MHTKVISTIVEYTSWKYIKMVLVFEIGNFTRLFSELFIIVQMMANFITTMTLPGRELKIQFDDWQFYGIVLERTVLNEKISCSFA